MKIDEQADDHREHAEAFGERGADDERRADLRRGVGVAADRARRQAGQDADADARANDAQRSEAGTEQANVSIP